MAHDVLIAGALFPDVPSVQFPDSQQQWHSFTDVSDTTAAASDVAQGKVFYDAQGTLTQGTASGGGGGAPKLGVLRPDAELWKSWTYDKRIVADEGKTIPSYSTSAQTMLATSDLEVVTLDDNYTYELVARTLATPVYNSESLGGGRFIIGCAAATYEVFSVPSGVMADHGVSFSASNFVIRSTVQQSSFYFSSAGQISILNGTSYSGCYAQPSTPTINVGVLTVKAPPLSMRGNSSSYTSTYWGRTTDVRYQYVIELYRTPRSNQYFDGYSTLSQDLHAIACAQSASGKLT